MTVHGFQAGQLVICRYRLPSELQGAELDGANLQGARLTNANLQHAGLFNANLQDAKLDLAKLQGARTIRATSWPEGWTQQTVEDRGVVYLN